MEIKETQFRDPRLCACGCGQSLQGKRPQAKFATNACRLRAFDKVRKLNRPFVGLDGEGETQKGKGHIYTLLAAGTGQWIGSKKGIDTEQCLEFLLNLPKGSDHGNKPIYVWFAMDYDINMILADLPLKGENSIETLRAENTVYWRGYRITYLRRKIFRIARGKRRHTSCDIWGFFQSTFERALEDWGIETPTIIKEGKAARSGFTSWPLHRIRDYNQAELDCLSILAEKLREAVNPLQLPIQSWHGPAALAGAWLQKNKVTEWKKEPETQHLADVAARAYFGGRIDVLGYGIVDPVYHYDIVSAYPSAIANLPNLQKIEWKHQGKGRPCGRLYVARIEWEIPATYWPPFPWRSKNGSIRYPLEGEGWYWFPEVETAIKKYGKKHFRICESYSAQGEIEYPFRELIHETFKHRAELKASGHPSHIAVKLVLNSLYGKFAQTVGKATYYSSIWAGLITSQTRAQLMSALNDDVVCVMTDSIWSKKPLDIPISSELGGWEQQNESQLTLAEAGLYEAIAPDGSKHIWQRGFDKRFPVDIQGLVTHWLTDDPTYKPVYNVNRFVGMGLASVTSHPWRQWVEIERAIEPVPIAGTTKRLPFYPSKEVADSRFVMLHPRQRDSKECSYPYAKSTTDSSLILERLEEECEE